MHVKIVLTAKKWRELTCAACAPAGAMQASRGTAGNMAGVDLPCAAGRVAVLECPRHSIHYRSRSTPYTSMYKLKPRHRGEALVYGGDGGS